MDLSRMKEKVNNLNMMATALICQGLQPFTVFILVWITNV